METKEARRRRRKKQSPPQAPKNVEKTKPAAGAKQMKNKARRRLRPFLKKEQSPPQAPKKWKTKTRARRRRRKLFIKKTKPAAGAEKNEKKEPAAGAETNK